MIPKTPFLYIALLCLYCVLIASCQNGPGQTAPAAQTAAPGKTTSPGITDTSQVPIIIQRDLSIDSGNSYSDLFTDSLYLETFLSKQAKDDTLARSFRNFYNSRNYELAWFAGDGFTEQALAFSTLYNYSKDSGTTRKWLDAKLEDWQNADTLKLNPKDPEMLHAELLMTWRFINYLTDRYPNERERTNALTGFVPVRKKTPELMAREWLASPLNADRPNNPWYMALIAQLRRYMTRPDSLAAGKKLAYPRKKYRPGQRSPYLVSLKLALHADKIWGANPAQSPPADTSEICDSVLRNDIRSFQAAHGLEPDGKIRPSLIDELNIAPSTRIRQLLVNLERMLWMPPDADGSLIVVNIPEFKMHVLDNLHPVFDMDIVVGKQEHGTVLFSGNLDRIAFNPYWNIPTSIVKNEILPGMKRNRHYLKAHDMEIVGKERGLPIIRQRPGPKNELGAMKFLFPNSFNIYFHDTPHKDLFRLNRRAFSHGCIRLADPPKLALYLLRGQPQWTRQHIDSVLAAKKEQAVKLTEPSPVLICYLTAWVGNENRVEFRDDVYGHDGRVAKMLFSDEKR